jgi:hypothetical protein
MNPKEHFLGDVFGKCGVTNKVDDVTPHTTLGEPNQPFERSNVACGCCHHIRDVGLVHLAAPRTSNHILVLPRQSCQRLLPTVDRRRPECTSGSPEFMNSRPDSNVFSTTEEDYEAHWNS